MNTIDVVKLIGTLDRCISEMLVMASNLEHYDLADQQTLKHHAEDAIAAGQKVLQLLNDTDSGNHLFHGVQPSPRCCSQPMRVQGNLSLHELEYRCSECQNVIRARVSFSENAAPHPSNQVLAAIEDTP